MKRRIMKLQSLLHIHFATIFRFPIVELLIAVFFIISFNNGLGGSPSPNLYLDEDVSETLSDMNLNLVTTTFSVFKYIIIFITPMFIAFTIAKGFESGRYGVIMTYPLRRWFVLVVDLFIVIFVLVISASSAAISASLLIGSPTVRISEMILFSIALWLAFVTVASTTAAIAVISKNTAATTVGGIGLWFTLTTVVNEANVPSMIKTIIDPLGGVRKFLISESMTYFDLVCGFVFGGVIAITALLISLMIFRISEL
ncbi:MAG: hypothetical protein ACW968_07660 [Candidatus Thorarchaeota archaeon]|jgi:hypothetical protein